MGAAARAADPFLPTGSLPRRLVGSPRAPRIGTGSLGQPARAVRGLPRQAGHVQVVLDGKRGIPSNGRSSPAWNGAPRSLRPSRREALVGPNRQPSRGPRRESQPAGARSRQSRDQLGRRRAPPSHQHAGKRRFGTVRRRAHQMARSEMKPRALAASVRQAGHAKAFSLTTRTSHTPAEGSLGDVSTPPCLDPVSGRCAPADNALGGHVQHRKSVMNGPSRPRSRPTRHRRNRRSGPPSPQRWRPRRLGPRRRTARPATSRECGIGGLGVWGRIRRPT